MHLVVLCWVLWGWSLDFLYSLVVLWVLILCCGIVKEMCVIPCVVLCGIKHEVWIFPLLSCFDLPCLCMSVVMGVGPHSPLWKGQRSPGWTVNSWDTWLRTLEYGLHCMPFSFIFCHERLCRLCVEEDVGLVVCVEEEVMLVVHCGGCWVGFVWWRRLCCVVEDVYEALRGMILWSPERALYFSDLAQEGIWYGRYDLRW